MTKTHGTLVSMTPVARFTVTSDFDPDDYGQKFSVLRHSTGFQLCVVKRNDSHVSVGQAMFATVEAAMDWADWYYQANGRFDV